MVQQELTLKNPNGLHMRPGRLFVAEAKKHTCNVSVIHNKQTADAKSLVGILKMGIGQGHQVTIVCDGENEQQTLHTLIDFVNDLKE